MEIMLLWQQIADKLDCMKGSHVERELKMQRAARRVDKSTCVYDDCVTDVILLLLLLLLLLLDCHVLGT